MIKITTGPVKSGKSKKLIDMYVDLTDAGIKTQVFSSKYSLTSGEGIVSRYGTEIKAIPISSLFDIQYHTKPDTKAILVDEFQFLDMNSKDIKFFIEKHHYDYDYYIYGLNLDYQKRPFKLMAHMMCYADEIDIVGGYCDICGAVLSKYSLRLENNIPAPLKDDGKIILLDGNCEDNVKIDYSAICENCWQEIYG